MAGKVAGLFATYARFLAAASSFLALAHGFAELKKVRVGTAARVAGLEAPVLGAAGERSRLRAL